MRLRTSDTNPLRVDFLSAEALKGSGRIGLTFAPGKKDLPGLWDRDLDADLDRLRGYYHADVLVCLLESHEFTLLRIPDLLPTAKQRGIELIWHPIRDVSVPKRMDEFVAVVEKILAFLNEGQTVVIHCRGGLGRSGLVAASCLVAFRYETSDGIRFVREARPGAIQTCEQQSFITDFHRAWWDKHTAG